jgi:hypothetical protein
MAQTGGSPLQLSIEEACAAAGLGCGEPAPFDFPPAHAVSAASVSAAAAALRFPMPVRLHAIACRNPLTFREPREGSSRRPRDDGEAEQMMLIASHLGL